MNGDIFFIFVVVAVFVVVGGVGWVVVGVMGDVQSKQCVICVVGGVLVVCIKCGNGLQDQVVQCCKQIFDLFKDIEQKQKDQCVKSILLKLCIQ